MSYRVEYMAAYREKNRDKIRQYSRDWAAKNPTRRVHHALMRSFGISWDEYSALLSTQGGACAVCAYVPPTNRRRLSVDHDHTTGKIRKLLCKNCNTALGCAKDDPIRLRHLADYLDLFTVNRK